MLHVLSQIIYVHIKRTYFKTELCCRAAISFVYSLRAGTCVTQIKRFIVLNSEFLHIWKEISGISYRAWGMKTSITGPLIHSLYLNTWKISNNDGKFRPKWKMCQTKLWILIRTAFFPSKVLLVWRTSFEKGVEIQLENRDHLVTPQLYSIRCYHISCSFKT